MGSNSEGVGEGFLLAWSGMYFPNICKLMEGGEGGIISKDLARRRRDVGRTSLHLPARLLSESSQGVGTWESELRASRCRVSGHKTFRDAVSPPDSFNCLVGIQIPLSSCLWQAQS